jgi:hypothetical protein
MLSHISSPDSLKETSNFSPNELAIKHRSFINNIKLQIGECPFDFGEEDDFDYKALKKDMKAYESAITVRKTSSVGISSREIESIQKVRKYSMQVENSY